MQMKNADIRREAWLILWRGNWFWRLVLASLLLSVLVFFIEQLAGHACEHFQIPHWGEYFGQYLMARLGQGLLAVPSGETAWRMTAATGTLVLFDWILEGCAAFGETLVVARAAQGRSEGWSSGLLSGFRAPFVHLALEAMTLLATYAVLAVLGVALAWATGGRCLMTWRGAAMLAVLLLVPNLVMRLYFLPLWLVRVAHPDWGVGACLGETRRLLRGNRGALLGLLLGYRPLLLLGLAGEAVLSLPETAVLSLAVLLLPAGVALYCVLAWHLRVSTAVFWRECAIR